MLLPVLVWLALLGQSALSAPSEDALWSLRHYGKVEVVDSSGKVLSEGAWLVPTDDRTEDVIVGFPQDGMERSIRIANCWTHLELIRKSSAAQEIPDEKGVFAPAIFNRRLRVELSKEDIPSVFVEMITLDYAGDPSSNPPQFRAQWYPLEKVVPRTVRLSTEDRRQWFAVRGHGNRLVPIILLARRAGLAYFATRNRFHRALRDPKTRVPLYFVDEMLLRRLDAARLQQIVDSDLGDPGFRHDGLYGPQLCVIADVSKPYPSPSPELWDQIVGHLKIELRIHQVQMFRDAARRRECARRLEEIGLK